MLGKEAAELASLLCSLFLSKRGSSDAGSDRAGDANIHERTPPWDGVGYWKLDLSKLHIN